jgi:hypothetical protein
MISTYHGSSMVHLIHEADAHLGLKTQRSFHTHCLTFSWLYYQSDFVTCPLSNVAIHDSQSLTIASRTPANDPATPPHPHPPYSPPHTYSSPPPSASSKLPVPLDSHIHGTYNYCSSLSANYLPSTQIHSPHACHTLCCPSNSTRKAATRLSATCLRRRWCSRVFRRRVGGRGWGGMGDRDRQVGSRQGW